MGGEHHKATSTPTSLGVLHEHLLSPHLRRCWSTHTMFAPSSLSCSSFDAVLPEFALNSARGPQLDVGFIKSSERMCEVTNAASNPKRLRLDRPLSFGFMDIEISHRKRHIPVDDPYRAPKNCVVVQNLLGGDPHRYRRGNSNATLRVGHSQLRVPLWNPSQTTSTTEEVVVNWDEL